MKTKLITLLFCAFAIVASATPADHKPVVKDGYVLRTIQQDAELKDWIVGMQRINAENRLQADAAAREAAKAHQAEELALGHSRELQENIDALKARADNAEKDLSSMTSARDFWRSCTWKLGLVSLALGIWTFRKPILALFGVSIP